MIYHKSEIPADLQRYFVRAEIGLEPTLREFIANMVEVFELCRQLLADDGTLWLNMGDSYAANRSYQVSDNKNPGAIAMGHQSRTRPPEGLKRKDLIGIPWRLAFALQADGWYLRQDIIWHKCLSGGAVVYAKTQKGEMPMTVKDLVRLDPAKVQLWDGQKWNQCLEWHKVEGDPDRATKSLAARQDRYRGRPSQVSGDIEFELRSGERIGCTREHRWPTSRGLLRADELTIGDVIDSCRTPEPQDYRRPAALDDHLIGWFVGLYIAEGSQSDGTIQIASHTNESERFARLEALAAAFDGYSAIHKTGGNSCTVNLNGPMLRAIVETYVAGRTSKDKHLSPRCWKRSNTFLRAVMDGYLSGDGGKGATGRWSLGFTDNDALASDLRALAARIGGSIRLRRCIHKMDGREFPGWGGTFYFDASRRKQPDAQIVAIRQSRARAFYDIVLQDDPHLFALASGVLTHNSNPMPESVTDRCTKAHEYLFLLTKRARYYFDQDAIKEDCSAGTHPRCAGNGYKTPDGWDTGKGAHGSFHKNGREKGRVPGNVNAPKGQAAYEAGDERHRTKAGLLDYAKRAQKRVRDVGIGGNARPRKAAPNGSGIKNNESFDSALTIMPDKRNKRSVWTIPTESYSEAHFATFPQALVEPCILAGSRPGDIVFDPFLGSGTVAQVAQRLGRHWVGCELNPKYIDLQHGRTRQRGLVLES